MYWLEKLDLIDKDAADWIRSERADCVDASDLDHAFTWRRTPQGQDYWEALYEKVQNFKETPVSKRHKHADLIIAWAEGAEIEHYSDSREEWRCVDEPYWYDEAQYRVKPKTRKEQRRIAVLSYEDREILSTVHYDFEGTENQSNFVRWATDIIEVALKGE